MKPDVNQKCWGCKNVYDGCSWSRKEKVPVRGWDATPTIKRSGGVTIHSYDIRDCPEFVEDRPDKTEQGGKLKYDIERFRQLVLAGMTKAEISRRMGGMPKPAIDRYLARVRKETKSNN